MAEIEVQLGTVKSLDGQIVVAKRRLAEILDAKEKVLSAIKALTPKKKRKKNNG